MTEILTDFSPSTLVTANKRNLFEYLEYLGTSSATNVLSHKSNEIKWMLTGMPAGFLNNVLYTNFDSQNASQKIEETLADFRSKRVKYLTWWAEPDMQPSTLGQELAANGLTYSPGMPGMAVDLQNLKDDLPKSSELIIETVQDAATLRNWVKPGLIGFGISDVQVRNICFDMFDQLGYELPLRLYVASLNGEPVATSQLFLGAGVAGVYWVATVPEARNKGIGAAISLAPLLDARSMGYRIGILQASPMGEPVYRRLGFQAYERLGHYIWENDDQSK